MLTALHELRIHLLGFAGVMGTLFFLFVFVFLHWLTPGISIVEDYISDFANLPYGFLFESTLAFHGLGNLAMALGLLVCIGSLQIGRSGAMLLAGAAVLTIVTAVFPTDPAATSTLVGEIHTISAFVSFALEALSLLFLAFAFQNIAEWRKLSRFTLFVDFIGVAALLWLVVAIGQGARPGIPEHALFIPYLWWEFLIALRLMTLTHTNSMWFGRHT